MSSPEVSVERTDELLKLASDIVAAYVSNNAVSVGDLPSMSKSAQSTLGGLAGVAGANAQTDRALVVLILKLMTPDYLICLEDGKKLKMLKRYLRSRYGLTPDQYRMKWGLPADYPMVASNYAARRSEFAKKIGLGRTAAPKGRKKK